MKRFVASVIACLLVLMASLASPSTAYAESNAIASLKSEVMPQLAEILTPSQQERFEESLSQGESFRKTFKALLLTPTQKRQVKSVLSSVPEKNVFASLSPMEKKGLFLKKKEAFMPSSEEIIDKINIGMPEGETVTKGVEDKIKAGLKRRDEFMPSSESILEKIEAKFKTGTEETAPESLDD